MEKFPSFVLPRNPSIFTVARFIKLPIKYIFSESLIIADSSEVLIAVKTKKTSAV